jgi:ribosomal protein L11 methyltransferase
MLDVGTGTGILARIARKRGVSDVAGTDIDPLALKAALENAALDAESMPIELTDQSPDAFHRPFDLVVANILEEPLKALASSIVRALSTDGTLLMSGFTALQIPSLQLAYEALGLKVVSQSSLEGWQLLQLKRRT